VADAERLGLQAGEEVRGLGGSLLTL